MPEHRRIDDRDLVNLRRSLGASGGLPRDEVERMLVELERLIAERHRVASLLERMHRPWPEVRSALNELDSIVRSRGEPPSR